jgi:dynein heavy chain, axonemal
MYLEPIFASDDIRKKLPLEHRKFEAIDRTFKNVMENYVKDPHLWESIDSDKIKNDFE